MVNGVCVCYILLNLSVVVNNKHNSLFMRESSRSSQQARRRSVIILNLIAKARKVVSTPQFLKYYHRQKLITAAFLLNICVTTPVLQ